MAKKSVPKLKPSLRKKWLELLQKSGVNPDDGSSTEVPEAVVLDTNVLISGILFGGKPRQVIEFVLGYQKLVLSYQIVDEFMVYLNDVRPKVPQKWSRMVGQKLEVYCYEVTAPAIEAVHDVNDTDIVRLAISQKAILVTGDRDILEYRNDARAVIVSVAEYSEIFLQEGREWRKNN